MVQAIAWWGLRPFGHRFTSPADQLTLRVVAWTNLAVEGEIASCTFSVNGVDHVVTERTMVEADHVTQPSPRTASGDLRPVFGFGYTVSAADYAAGTITCTAKVTSTLGTETTVPYGPVVVHNDKDGTDRRPNPSSIYVNADTGNDGNPGTIGSPVFSIQKAFDLLGAAATLHGATAGDMGGGTVVLQASTARHRWARGYYGAPSLWTSGAWWVTLLVEDGATIERNGALTGGGAVGWTDPDDRLILNGNSGAEAVRLLMVCEASTTPHVIRGDLKVLTHAGSTVYYACDGALLQHERFDAATRPHSVRFSEGAPELFDDVTTSNRPKFYECCVMRGVNNGFASATLTIDCVVSNWLGQAWKATGYNPDGSSINCLATTQRYNHEVAGKIDSVVGSKVSITNDAGTMVVQQLAATTINAIEGGVETAFAINIGEKAAELIGSPMWGVQVTGSANPANNGTFAVLEVGTSGGLPWIRLDNASAVNEATAGASVQLWTARLSDGATYTAQIHPDVVQFEQGNGCLVQSLRCVDAPTTRGIVSSSANLSRIAIVNSAVAASGANDWGYTPGQVLDDILFLHCDFLGSFALLNTVSSARCEVRKSVFGSATGLGTTGWTVDGNHFIGGSSAGTNARTGTFLANDYGVSPFDLTPTTGNQGQAPADGLDYPADLAWPAAGSVPTAGVWIDVGDPSYEPSTAVISGSGAATMSPATSSGSGTTNAQATGAGAGVLAAVSGAGTGTIGGNVDGSGAATLSSIVAGGSGSVSGVQERTHYYHAIGDAHVRGRTVGGPEILGPGDGLGNNADLRLEVLFPPTPAAAVNDIVRGQTSGAVGRIVRIVTPTVWILKSMPSNPPLPAAPGAAFAANINPAAFPFSGEVVQLDSGGTANVSFAASGQQFPGFSQYVGETQDPELSALIPADGSDGVFYYQTVTRARQVTVTGSTGTAPFWRPGDRVQSSSGGTATVIFVNGSFALKIVKVVGTIQVGDTLTNLTLGGGTSGAVTEVEPAQPVGEWAPFSLYPNVRGLGVFYEIEPQGNNAGGGTPSIGPEARLIPRLHAHHMASLLPADRGVRYLQFSTLDAAPDGDVGQLDGGVVIQMVRCSGTFPTTWIVGETLTAPGSGWSGTLQGWNAVQKILFVRQVNGLTLGAEQVIGLTSESAADSTGAAYGWQRGSRHFNAWKANLEKSIAAVNSRFMDAPIKHEHIVAMPWETELRPFSSSYACPIPTEAQAVEEFARWIKDLRQELGDNEAEVGVTLWQHRLESQQFSVTIGSIPFSYLLRLWIGGVPTKVPNVTVVDSHTMGAEMAPAVGGQWLYLRTQDYVELGDVFWRHMRFGQVSIPEGNGYELLPVGIHVGQSQQTGFIPAGLADIDRNPDLWPKTLLGGIANTVDPNLIVWNTLTKQLEPFAVDVNANGSWGTIPGTCGPEVPVVQRMKMRFSSSITQSAKFGLFKFTIPGSSKHRDVQDSVACWDPILTSRPSVGVVATVTVQPAAGQVPARGRFTAAAGTFSTSLFQVNQSSVITGSAAGGLTQGAGGNNTAPWDVNRVHAIANDGSWIEFVGSFVAEGPRTFTLTVGPPAAWPAFVDEWNDFLDACHDAGYRPMPVYIWDDHGESDLALASSYADVLQRFWVAIESLCGARLKGGQPIAKLISLVHTQTPVDVPDENITVLRAAQVAQAAAMANATTLDPSDLPLELKGPGDARRLTRQQNGIHLTPLGFIQKGFLADAKLATLVGIPPHPAGELSSGAIGGNVNGGTAAVAAGASLDDGPPSSEATSTDAPVASLTSGEASSLKAAIEAAWAQGVDVLSYTVNGKTITRNNPRDLMELHRYLTTLELRQSGVRRTRVRWN